jgi:hypothetical protein
MIWMQLIYPQYHLVHEDFTGFKWLVVCFTVSWSLLLIFGIVSNVAVRAIVKKKGIKQI